MDTKLNVSRKEAIFSGNYQFTSLKVGENNNNIGFERFDAANYLKNYMANKKITDTSYGLKRIDEDPDNFYYIIHDFHQVAGP